MCWLKWHTFSNSYLNSSLLTSASPCVPLSPCKLSTHTAIAVFTDWWLVCRTVLTRAVEDLIESMETQSTTLGYNVLLRHLLTSEMPLKEEFLKRRILPILTKAPPEIQNTLFGAIGTVWGIVGFRGPAQCCMQLPIKMFLSSSCAQWRFQNPDAARAVGAHTDINKAGKDYGVD